MYKRRNYDGFNGGCGLGIQARAAPTLSHAWTTARQRQLVQDLFLPGHYEAGVSMARHASWLDTRCNRRAWQALLARAGCTALPCSPAGAIVQRRLACDRKTGDRNANAVTLDPTLLQCLGSVPPPPGVFASCLLPPLPPDRRDQHAHPQEALHNIPSLSNPRSGINSPPLDNSRPAAAQKYKQPTTNWLQCRPCRLPASTFCSRNAMRAAPSGWHQLQALRDSSGREQERSGVASSRRSSRLTSICSG